MRQPLARDTSPAAEARQIALFRERTPTQRLASVFELTAFAYAASRAAITSAYPQLDALGQARLLLELQFGPERAAQLRSVPTMEGPMSIPAALMPVVAAFEQLRIPYYVGGSIASSAYSLPRTTYDVDMVAALRPEHIAPFANKLEAEYYVDRGAIVDALTHGSAFNMTHQETGINIDIFIAGSQPFDQIQFTRIQLHTLPGATHPVALASPEDVVLNKLIWYELGNRVSDQQWRDVQSVLRVQARALDEPYLRHWAAHLGLDALLEAALRGERPPQPPADPQQLPLL